MKWGIIDRSGRFVVPPTFEFIGRFNRDGLAPFRKGNREGFVDRSGQVVLEPVLAEVTGLSEGLTTFEKEGKTGFADVTGRMPFEKWFDYADAFRFGRALVEVDGLSGFIDARGEYAIRPQYGVGTRSFEEAMAVVDTPEGYRYVDVHGTVIAGPFRQAERFRDGLAVVGTDHGDRLVDRSGRLLDMLPKGCVNLTGFSEGLCAFSVRRGDGFAMGFMSRGGDVVVPPTFESIASFFHEARAPVLVDGKYGFIDPTGHYVVRPNFERVESFSEGLCCVASKGKSGFIAHNGELVIPCQFGAAHDFVGGVAAVAVD